MFDIKKNNFMLFLIASHLNALQYNTLFPFMAVIVRYFLHSTSVLSFYIDAVLTLSTNLYYYAFPHS